MIYGNQILCKSDFKMNFEQFIKWIKFKTDLWTFIQINILNDFDFHISLSDFSIKRTNKYVLVRKFTTMSIQDLNRGL